ncbi:MAG: glycerophosphodiester phosphodiesterase [Noviherbaspirillum sp.]
MWPFPRIIAHRGGGTLAPENTLAGLRCGLSHGFHAVEFDVMLSRDGIPVLMHDPAFGRTVAGEGQVADTSAEDLCAMDAGAWFGPAHAGEKVPFFAQAIDFCLDNRIWMNVEIKPAPGFAVQTGRAAAQMLQARLADGQAPGGITPLFSSFSMDALQAAREAAPGIPRGFLIGTIPDQWEDILRELDAVALHTNHKHLTPELAKAVKEAGYGLFCYTVDDPERAREILSWGVDAFCTDRLDLIGPDFA